MNFETNKIYFLKLGQAEPERAIYLGIKRFTKSNIKYVFLSYNSEKKKFQVYLSNPKETIIGLGLVQMISPHKRKLNPLEIELLEPFFKRLENK